MPYNIEGDWACFERLDHALAFADGRPLREVSRTNAKTVWLTQEPCVYGYPVEGAECISVRIWAKQVAVVNLDGRWQVDFSAFDLCLDILEHMTKAHR